MRDQLTAYSDEEEDEEEDDDDDDEVSDNWFNDSHSKRLYHRRVRRLRKSASGILTPEKHKH